MCSSQLWQQDNPVFPLVARIWNPGRALLLILRGLQSIESNVCRAGETRIGGTKTGPQRPPSDEDQSPGVSVRGSHRRDFWSFEYTTYAYAPVERRSQSTPRRA